MSQISQMIHGTVPENASNWIQVRHGESGKKSLLERHLVCQYLD